VLSVLNGAGELTCRSQIQEWGYIETPVFLTSTMQVGRVYDAACQLLMAEHDELDEVIIPVVGECDDSWLSDPRTMHVTHEDVQSALAAARSGGPFARGASGRRHRHALPGLEGRHRFGIADPAGRASRRGAAAHELRQRRAAAESTGCQSGSTCSPTRPTSMADPAPSPASMPAAGQAAKAHHRLDPASAS
jgi:D-aminopeptidase